MSTFETLNVGQLKQLLADYADDLPVTAVANYGDRCNTMQAVSLCDLGIGKLSESSYSDSGFKVSDCDEQGEEVLVLNLDQV